MKKAADAKAASSRNAGAIVDELVSKLKTQAEKDVAEAVDNGLNKVQLRVYERNVEAIHLNQAMSTVVQWLKKLGYRAKYADHRSHGDITIEW